MADYETHEHDVLVIGAGGAGLRAAIEASAAGVRVGLVCKSLLGKAHTVMAEGGIAAALANVDERDNWKVHFADTMRGGQYVNQWRMAELHAKEAPDRVRELEAWGAVFDRTKDGRILQRHFGGHKYARRPPELLTRDHVSRCIVREIKEGRGSPHGGVFLDIAWIKSKIPNAAEHIKKKLPSMYHQFKQLADIDITEEPMEVGPTTHYAMGGVRVEGDTQMSRLPGLFAAGECAAGINGADRLGGNSLSDLLVFGKRAGEHAAQFAKDNKIGKIDNDKIDIVAKQALAPFENSGGENPYEIQKDLQEL